MSDAPLPLGQKILVTGATGFVGQHLVPRLLTAGYQVRCLCRPTSVKPADFADKVEWVVGDLNDRASLSAACQDVGVVIHLAGTIKARQEEQFLIGNTHGTLNLLDALDAVNSPAKFIYVSSLSAAGPSSSWQPKTEIDPAFPVSLYGQSKLQAEIEVLRRSQQRWTAIVRPAVVYGPGDRETLIYYKLARSRLSPRTNPQAKRVSMIYVGDLVELIYLLCQSPLPSGEIFFAADLAENGYSWNEIIAQAAQFFPGWRLKLYLPTTILHAVLAMATLYNLVFDPQAMLLPDKLREIKAGCWTCSGQKARQLLGFTPQYDLQHGMELAVKWYKEQKWL